MIKKVSTIRYNEDTGEVYSEGIKSYKSKLWIDGKGAMLKPRTYHKKIYSDIKLSEIIKEKSDLLKTYILVDSIYKDTNTIYVRTSKNNFRPANILDISKLFGITEKKTREYLRRMIKAGIIGELVLKIKDEEYTSYVFNPIYINSSKYISNDIYILFKPYLDKYFPDWIREKYIEINENDDIEEYDVEYVD